VKAPDFLPLLRTTAVRLAVRNVLVYALLLALSLGAVLWLKSRQLDAQPELRLEQELRALIREYESNGEAGLIAALARHEQATPGEEGMTLLIGPDGARRAGNLLGWSNDTDGREDGRAHHGWIDQEFLPKELYDDDVYVAAVTWRFADGSRLMLARRDREAEGLLNTSEYLTEVLSVAVALALVMALIQGRWILRRMDTIGRTAGEILAGDLSKRVPVSAKGDEFDTLAQRLNAMLDRIQQLIRGMREVTDNVAHDLRSPLTRLRNRLEVTLLEPRSQAEYRQALDQGIDDADGLIKTFNALLAIAQTEAGSRRTHWDTVDLSAIARDLAELYAPLAEERGQTLEISNGEPVPIVGSRDLLAQALGNVLDNAVKYTPVNGTIQLRIGRRASAAEVRVTDSGPGIPESEHQRVIERFVRLDSSRHTPGNGLGLALVAAVTRLHQAELILADARPGLIVTMRFPDPKSGVSTAAGRPVAPQ
jgi:signal transduction histidine kinase